MAGLSRDRANGGSADWRGMEPLEPRVLLFDAPFLSNLPSVDELEAEGNTVVRFQTNFGIIDIELFDSVAPITVQNFLRYVDEGAYDEMFFHRSITQALSTIGVVQGGGYKYRDGTGKTDITTHDPIVNEFGRLNEEGTIAMAKVGGQPNSATSQFYFNVTDNPALNSPLNSGGFTVFGKVIRGWSVIQAINGLAVQDLDAALTGTNSTPGLFDTTPVSGSFNPGAGPNESTLVYVWDAEVVRRGSAKDFYREAVYFPEGFRTPAITERVDLLNDSAVENHYQIIVRYESGERDEVIATGVLQPRARRTIDIAKSNDPGINLVRSGVGYAIEVRSTDPLSAALNHRDFGVTLGEAFVRAEDLAAGTLRNWTFAHGEKGAPFRSFLVWQNLTPVDATVTVTFYHNTQAPRTFTYTLPRYGRGGVNIDGLGFAIPNGRYSVNVSSTHAIVAALSLYETSGSGATQVTNGSGATGVIGGGRTEGYLAAARRPSNSTALLSFVYTQGAPAQVTVDVFFYLTDGTTLTATNPVVLTTTNRRADRNLTSFGVQIPVDQFFSIGYKVRNNAGNVSVHYVSKEAGDTMSTPFTVISNGALQFADGYIEPSGLQNGYAEVLSLFSPYTKTAIQSGYRVRFRFSDGTVVEGPTGALGPKDRVDIVPHQIPALMAKVNSAPRFRNYSIVVETGHEWHGTPFSGALVAQLTRIHGQPGWRQTMITGPTLHESLPLVWMNSGQYD